MQKHVTLGELVLPKDANPRRSFDKTRIRTLAASIEKDGVLQNLVVSKNGNGQFHILAGKRRYLALSHLKKRGVIDGTYKVPVIVKSKLEAHDALRIATVENVQREPLDPLDEAEAFAALVSSGKSLEDVAAETGVSENTVRRRLALAGLSLESKAALKDGAISLSLAEAFTLGTETQQNFFLKALKEGATLSPDDARRAVLAEKPSLAIALFPREAYTGSVSTDLFGDDTTTYFDDIDLFMKLQEDAVEAKAVRYRKKYAHVEILHEYRVPWWLYRDAESGEEGVCILNLSPTGQFEMRKNVVKRIDGNEAEQPRSPRAKAKHPYGPSLYRYVSSERSVAVQAALLGNVRKRKEVAVTLLLSTRLPESRIRIETHPCLKAFALGDKPKGFELIASYAQSLGRKLGVVDTETVPFWSHMWEQDAVSVYARVTTLSEAELDDLLSLIPLLCFGQVQLEGPEPSHGFFSQLCEDIGLDMRAWWRPDIRFLDLLSRNALETVAVQSGANYSLNRLAGYKKPELVAALDAYFARTAHAENPDEIDKKGATWVPDVMKTGVQEATNPPEL
jgi:ParB family transcriptional regulator, chromosome partitioning protein